MCARVHYPGATGSRLPAKQVAEDGGAADDLALGADGLGRPLAGIKPLGAVKALAAAIDVRAAVARRDIHAIHGRTGEEHRGDAFDAARITARAIGAARAKTG